MPGVLIFTKVVQVSSYTFVDILFIFAIDMRLPSCKAAAQQRSINLAISHRGIAALEAIEPALAPQFLQSAIPMRGRMIHKQMGELVSQLYDRDGQVTYLHEDLHVFLSDHMNLVSV